MLMNKHAPCTVAKHQSEKAQKFKSAYPTLVVIQKLFSDLPSSEY